MKSILISILSLTVLSQAALALEPAYCNPKTFFSKEFDPRDKIVRDHSFRMGDVILVGGAIGLSRTKNVIKFVEEYSNADVNEKYCTWYFNDGANSAEKAFHHFYVNHPKKLTTVTGPAEYRAVLKDQFAKAPTSFLSCMEKEKILVMGCDGQMHRGPTVFGMLLSYSGCSPTNANAIVNKAWGLNGVPPEVRLAIIQEGYKLGSEDPQARLRMQRAFGY
jgi:hypothetical protein